MTLGQANSKNNKLIGNGIPLLEPALQTLQSTQVCITRLNAFCLFAGVIFIRFGFPGCVHKHRAGMYRNRIESNLLRFSGNNRIESKLTPHMARIESSRIVRN